MLKILFYHANDYLALGNDFHLGVASLYLKTHIDNHCPGIKDQIEWMIPQQRHLTDDELINLCNSEQIDLLCSSHYIWNNSNLMIQLESIRDRLLNTKIVAGGPSIDVNIDPEFFKKYPFIDYAVYGSGENAFAYLLESIIEQRKLIAFNTSNLAWQNQNRQIVSDFKYVPQLLLSPYISNKQMFSKMIEKECANGTPVEHLVVPYDLTRGCPYSCTFCDWNSGLSNKVSRRKNTYQEEIDLFHQLGLKHIYLSDANIGQYEEDIEMMKYFAKKNLEENAGFQLDGNFSKLKKDNNLKLYHIMAKGGLTNQHRGFIISVQDPNLEVLKNIDRPDVGWDEHEKIINELHDHYPNISTWIQMIQGLPGQTVESWRQSLATVAKTPVELSPFISELLPASPAARDKVYQERFQFVYSTSLRFNGRSFYQGIFPESCVSFSKRDFVKMNILTIIYTTLLTIRFKTQTPGHVLDIEDIVDKLLQTEEINILEENLYDNWHNHNNFFFTKQFAPGMPESSPQSACLHNAIAYRLMNNTHFLRLLLRASPNSLSTAFKNTFLNMHKNQARQAVG